MDLPEYFEFSQSSLQDYVDCRRRFQLRYVQRIAWPAVQAEPVRENEQTIQRGNRFHHLVQQYLLGLPEEKLARMAAADEDENLQRWWNNFITSLPAQLSGQKQVEISLSAPLAGFRLRAVYDLVLFETGGKIIIYDWKTGTHRPKRAWLRDRLQTRVYPFLLVQAGAALNGGKPVTAENVEMIYWFAEPGQEPERIVYSAGQYEADQLYLLGLIQELRSLSPEQFTLTTIESTCRFCVYRSLCNRGLHAGNLTTDEGEMDYEAQGPERLDFDFEQINEIGF